jgi:hypothetical protein
MKQLTKEQKRRYRAIRKGVQTRQANRAWRERWDKVEAPAQQQFENLVNRLLKITPVQLLWNPINNSGMTLRKGALYGTLLSVHSGGSIYRVLPEGYKRPHTYHRSFWEPLIPEAPGK